MHRCNRMVWIWPPKTPDRLYIFKATANIVMLLYYFVGAIMYPVAVLRDEDAIFQEKINATSMVMAIFTLIIEYLTSFYLSDKSIALFEQIKNFEIFGVPRNIVAANQYANRITLFLILYCLVASFIIGMHSVSTIAYCERQKRSKYTICGFSAGLYYPYDISDGFLYYLHVTMQIYWFCILCTGGVSFSCGCISAIEFMVARIDHLKEMLGDIFKDGNPDRKEMKKLVRYHAYILQLVTKFNDCYRIATAPALFNYSAVLGLTILSFFVEQNVKTILHPFGWFTAILLICYAGEKLMTKSTSVGELLYELEWYNVNVAIQKDILFMLMRSQKAVVFESGPMGVFSLETMKRIMRGAYTFKTLTTGLDTSG